MTLLLQPMFPQKQRRNRSHAIPEPKGKRTPLCEGGVKFGSSHGDTLEQGGVPARLNLAHSPKPVCDEYHKQRALWALLEGREKEPRCVKRGSKVGFGEKTRGRIFAPRGRNYPISHSQSVTNITTVERFLTEVLAATNKCLARSNKSIRPDRTINKATSRGKADERVTWQ